MISQKNIPVQSIWQLLETVSDPEIPVLSIIDLGIVRDVLIVPSLNKEIENEVNVIITPTYSGCPAMDVISMNIRMALLQNGIKNFKITQQLSPAWTTDWMTENGKQKLKAYGIAPPQSRPGETTERINKMFSNDEAFVECPQCNSKNTERISQFGSTACKALYQCLDCREPFDYFKCH
ncbi:MAG: phenylacetate-CoA oxygenase subunit PaaJ [Chitinophagaceae bacterium]|nr:phenylacetate-CoA oxygenase subunit PaaJ [Chitinophagaceae bacterium]